MVNDHLRSDLANSAWLLTVIVSDGSICTSRKQAARTAQTSSEPCAQGTREASIAIHCYPIGVPLLAIGVPSHYSLVKFCMVLLSTQCLAIFLYSVQRDHWGIKKSRVVECKTCEDLGLSELCNGQPWPFVCHETQGCVCIPFIEGYNPQIKISPAWINHDFSLRVRAL